MISLPHIGISLVSVLALLTLIALYTNLPIPPPRAPKAPAAPEPAAMSSFRAFTRALSHHRTLLDHAQPLHPTTLVLGNESGDMDSMVSAISLAYYLTSTTDRPATPLINIRRKDLSLRPDCQALLTATLGAQTLRDLLFIDEIDLAAHRSAPIWLVDHNAPASRQASLAPQVRGIVDHHIDEGKCANATTRDIQTVGSCTSLVAMRMRDAAVDVDAGLAKLMVAPILIDTANLSVAANKATAVDRDAVAWLEARVVDWSLDSVHELAVINGVGGPAQFYKALDKLKGRVSHMPSSDLLRKDYKQWDVEVGSSRASWALGISSISYRLDKWIARDGKPRFVRALEEHLVRQNLDIAAVMAHGKTKVDGTKVYGRELVVAFGERVARRDRDSVLRALEDDAALGLVEYAGPEDGVVFYTQQRIEASRKQVFPAFKRVIESL